MAAYNVGMIVLAKVTPFGAYADLEAQGLIMGVSVNCPNCDVDYRIFYTQKDNRTIQEWAMEAPILRDKIADSHPSHSHRIVVK